MIGQSHPKDTVHAESRITPKLKSPSPVVNDRTGAQSQHITRRVTHDTKNGECARSVIRVPRSRATETSGSRRGTGRGSAEKGNRGAEAGGSGSGGRGEGQKRVGGRKGEVESGRKGTRKRDRRKGARKRGEAIENRDIQSTQRVFLQAPVSCLRTEQSSRRFLSHEITSCHYCAASAVCDCYGHLRD